MKGKQVMKCKILCIFLALMMMAGFGCTTYKEQAVPFKLPQAYPNRVDIENVSLAAVAFADSQEASQVFGFDIREAGLLPIQVIVDNRGNQGVEILSQQTFLIDRQNNLWNILDNQMAYDRVAKSSELGSVAKGAIKPGILGGAAGALLGAAIGIVTGGGVGQAAGRGAALGAAVGATLGGAGAYASGSQYSEVSKGLQSKSLENRPVKPGEIAHGFLFFPGEAASARELRLQVRLIPSGKVHILILPL
jgi:hypothetical protein